VSSILVTVITGFLGSGKTTLLNTLLKSPDLATSMVIVNEFGEIGVDSDLMQSSSENIVQLANGCLCCSVKGDLIDTFRDLIIQRQAGTLPKFDRVVIETTGIADPVPVAQIILTNPMVRNAYTLDGVVTTVDAVNGMETLASFPESIRQVAIADRIVVTKADLLRTSGGDQLARLKRNICALNPRAPIIEALDGQVEVDQILGRGVSDGAALEAEFRPLLGSTGAAVANDLDAGSLDSVAVAATYLRQGHRAEDLADIAGSAPRHSHGADIRTFCVIRNEPVSFDTLRLFVDAISRDAGPKLLRVKGLVNVAGEPGRPAIIQGAQQIMHSLDWLPAWPSDDRRSRIVFITRGIEQAYVEDAFALVERIARRTAQAAGRLG